MRKRYFYVSLGFLLLISLSAKAATKAQLDLIVKNLRSNDPNVCSKAAIKLAEYGPSASDAIPALLEIIRNQEQNLYAGSVLPYISTGKTVQEILMLTKDENSMVQSLAMECLKQFDIDKAQALEIYSDLLDHENAFVRLGAIDALCQVGAGELCLDTVIQLTRHEDPLIKAFAISALEDTGIADKQVKQALLDSFANTDKREVVKAALIYQKLYSQENKGIEQIRILLNDEDRNVRWHAVRAVGNLKDVDAQTLQLARELMHDKDKIVVTHACYAMIRHHIETEQAWEVLNKSLESDDFEELLSPLMVLRELGSAAHNYQELLLKMVNHEGVQLIAIFVLGEIQPSKDRVLPVLEKKLKTTDDFLIWNRTNKTIKKIKLSKDN